MRHLILILFAAASMSLLAGCNTIKGLGTDIHDMAQNTQQFFEDTTGYHTDSYTPSPSSNSRSINRSVSAN